MELSYSEAVQQLRMAAQLRWDALALFPQLEDDLDDAQARLPAVNEAYGKAQEIATAFRAKWIPERDDVLLEIADIERVLGAVRNDLNKSRKLQQVAYNRGRRVDAANYRNEMNAYEKEAFTLRHERAEYQAVLASIDESMRAVDESLVAIKQANDEAHAAVHAAKQALETHLAAIRDAEMQYANAEAQFVAAERARRSRRKSLHQSMLSRADVPASYQSSVKIVTKQDGTTHFFFGGTHGPASENHGHYVFDPSWLKVYARDPFEPHGPHNHLIPKQEEGTDPTQP